MEKTPNGDLPQSKEKNRRTLQLTPEKFLKNFTSYLVSGFNVNEFGDALNVLKKYEYYHTLEYYFEYIIQDLSDNDIKIYTFKEKGGFDIISKTYWFIIQMFADEMDKVTQITCCTSGDDIVVDGTGIFSYICFDRTPSVKLQEVIDSIPLAKKKSLSKLSKMVIEEDLKLRLYTTVQERGMKITEFNSDQ